MNRRVAGFARTLVRAMVSLTYGSKKRLRRWAYRAALCGGGLRVGNCMEDCSNKVDALVICPRQESTTLPVRALSRQLIAWHRTEQAWTFVRRSKPAPPNYPFTHLTLRYYLHRATTRTLTSGTEPGSYNRDVRIPGATSHRTYLKGTPGHTGRGNPDLRVYPGMSLSGRKFVGTLRTG
jgi:hypothetical protein